MTKRLTKPSFVPHDHPYRDDILTWVHARLADPHLKNEPRVLILIAHGFVERLVDEVLKAKCRHGRHFVDDKEFSHGAKLMILHALQLVDDELFTELDWLRKIRNEAAHQPFFKLSGQHLSQCKTADPDRLSSFLMRIISVLMNRHAEVLKPIFLPNEDNAHYFIERTRSRAYAQSEPQVGGHYVAIHTEPWLDLQPLRRNRQWFPREQAEAPRVQSVDDYLQILWLATRHAELPCQRLLSEGGSQISIATGRRGFLEENLGGCPEAEARAGAVIE